MALRTSHPPPAMTVTPAPVSMLTARGHRRRERQDVGISFYINWVMVPICLVPAIAIAIYARHVSGGSMQPWISLKPVWWFLLLFLLPPLGFLLLVVNLAVHRHTPGAITGRQPVG